MNKQNVLFTIIGILIGFIGGFFLANSINRNASLQATTSPSNPNAPFLNAQNNPQTSVDIKDSSAGAAAVLPEVAETLEKAKNEPDNFQAQIKAGEMYARIQNREKANEFLQNAVKAHADNFQDLATLGNGFFDLKNYEEAEKWYALALAKNPEDVDVRTDLGSTFMERAQPDLDRAIKEYRTSLEKNPRHENTLYNLTLALQRKGDAPGAQAMLAQLEKINPGSPLIVKLKEKVASAAK